MTRTYWTLALVAVGIAGSITLSSSSSGVAQAQNQNRTGSPGSSSTCNACHGGGNFGASVAIAVLDPNSGEEVVEYLPGEQYVLEVAVNHSFGSPLRYGMQATAVLDGSGYNAGTFITPSANTQLEDVQGLHIF